MFQQFYSLVDLLIVGNFAANGQDALTAVGQATTIVNILLAFSLGSNAGCSVIVAKYFGAKNNLKIQETVRTALVAFTVLCVALMAVGFGLARLSLVVIETDAGLIPDSLAYLNIYIGSLPFVFLYNVGCGICTALGDSRTPFLFLVASSLFNIALDFLFVCGLHMDVAGAAWATLIAQAIACILTTFVLIKKLRAVPSEVKPKWFDKFLLKELTVASVPVILQNSFVSVGNFFVMKRINQISKDAATGFTTAFKLVQIANIGVGSFTNGLANFASQNRAAGEFKRIKVGWLASLIYAMISTCIFLIFFEIFPVPLTNLFISNPTEDAIAYSAQFLQFVSAFLPVVCIKIVCDGCVRGCGGNLGFTISTFTDLIARVIFVYWFTGIGMGFYGVCLAWALGWALGMVVAIAFFLGIKCLRGVHLIGKPKHQQVQ
jgi:putative MATE family efflux protein